MNDVAAKIGDSIFLIPDSSVTQEEPNPPSRMINIIKGLSYIIPFQQALKWGYWEEVTEQPSEAKLKELESYFDNVSYDFIKNVSPQFVGKETTPQTASYTVYEGPKVVGVLSFGGAPAIEITTRNDKLLELVTKSMVSPVEVKDDAGGTIYSTIGDFQYELAVLQLLRNEGFEYKKR